MTARPTTETRKRLQAIVEQAWNCLRAHERARSSKGPLAAAFQKHIPFFVVAFGLVLTPIWAVMVAWIPAHIVSMRLLNTFAGFWGG